MFLYIWSSYNASWISEFECGCQEILLIKICSLFNNYIFSLYRDLDANYSICDCLLNSIATVQDVDTRASFVFIGYVNAHHWEWLNSISPTDAQGKTALDFSYLSRCDQIHPNGISDHSGVAFNFKKTFFCFRWTYFLQTISEIVYQLDRCSKWRG